MATVVLTALLGEAIKPASEPRSWRTPMQGSCRS